MRPIRLSPKRSNLNADAERFVRGTNGTVCGSNGGSHPKRGSPVEYDPTLSHTSCVGNTERVTVTLSGDLVDGIDQLERNRSRFIAEAVQRELARRRRDALLQSLSSPHPETTELADISLADWTSDLPNDDEGLVDPRGGTAVRWIEDRGWVKEPA